MNQKKQIKSNRIIAKSATVMIALTMIISSCATKLSTNSNRSTNSYTPNGVWNYVVETPGGAAEGVMTITDNEGAYAVTMKTADHGIIAVDNVVIEGLKLTGTFFMEAVDATLNLRVLFSGDNFEGEFFLDQTSMPLTATRTDK